MGFAASPLIAGLYRIKTYAGDSFMQATNSAAGRSRIGLKARDPTADTQLWEITPIQRQPDRFIVHSASGQGLTVQSNDSSQYPGIRDGGSDWWRIKQSEDGMYSRISTSLLDFEGFLGHNRSAGDEAVSIVAESNEVGQRWVFESVDTKKTPIPPKSFTSRFFSLTVEQVKQEKYDIIIVGTGIGGGVLAGDLFDTNIGLGKEGKKILVIEKGDLVFHTHALNGARPSDLQTGQAQQNPGFYDSFKDNYKLSSESDTEDWKGGPMHCLGGRSAAWGLFVPRIPDEVLKTKFDPNGEIYNALVTKYYRDAELLMGLASPKTQPIHMELMDDLNKTAIGHVNWKWGRIASEFKNPQNFAYPKGAFSSIDKLLEIAMSSAVSAGDSGVNLPAVTGANFKILLGTDVRRIQWDDKNTTAAGVLVRSADGKEETIELKPGGKVVVCAGSVGSPTILLRSGLETFLRENGGLHLTDHDMFGKSFRFRYRDPTSQDKVGPLKLMTDLVLPQVDEVILSNLSVDPSTFLSRKFVPKGILPGDDHLAFVMAFTRPAPLNTDNTIHLVDDEPVLTVNRKPKFDQEDTVNLMLQEFTEEANRVLEQILGIELVSEGPAFKNKQRVGYFDLLGYGGVAHELGTVPIDTKAGKQCLDSRLAVHGVSGVYVCDLSIFPYSAAANPSLTLAALALRLSRETLLTRQQKVRL